MSLPERIVLWILIVAGLLVGMDNVLFPPSVFALFFGIVGLLADIYLIKVQVQRR